MSNHSAQVTRLIEWGVASRSLDCGEESGDCYAVKLIHCGALLAVVDGLGHGKQAAESAKLAVSTVCEHTENSIPSIFVRCHEQLKGTRGVVMSLALFNAADRTMAWAGIGNVEGLLIRRRIDSAARANSLMLRSGVIGYRLPHVRASIKTVSPGDFVILSTDGIRTGFDEGLNLRSPPQQIANSILASHRRDDDDALVLVARYVGS
jgi:serine/threonine protein phosphatase PrpC